MTHDGNSSFWGNPTLEPRDKDVARFVEVIRELADDRSDKFALGLSTSALQAITSYVVNRFGPKEALALLDKMRGDIFDRVNKP